MIYMKFIFFIQGGDFKVAKDGKHIFGTVKVGERGQIVIPKEARDLYGIKSGDMVLILGDDKGIALLKPEIFQELLSNLIPKE